MPPGRASNGFGWKDHDYHKEVTGNSPMKVRCDCGWESDPRGGWAMDQYRAHVTSLMPKHEEVKTAAKVKRLEHYGQTRGRRR